MNKKKFLFLSYNYPYGAFGPSTMCSVRVMNELSMINNIEVHCVCINGENATYEINPNIIIHPINFTPKSNKNIFQYIRWAIFYPIQSFRSGYALYKKCKPIIDETHYDMVVAQYFQEPSLLAGLLLKRKRCIDNFTVIFWDILYGKVPRRFLPRWYSLSRQKMAENYVAKYADTLISLYPTKEFHQQKGDVPSAMGKRYYLGIPSITRPTAKTETAYRSIIKPEKINMLYSGTIFKEEYVRYMVELLNHTEQAEQINLIFFSRGVDDCVFDSLRQVFKGEICKSDWIPLKELLSIYHDIDCFVSFPGNYASVRSKLYEYVSYGTPVILLYDDNRDVNVTVLSRYPLSLAIDERIDAGVNAPSVSEFLSKTHGHRLQFEEVEKLFPQDTASAYVDLLLKQLD